MKEETTFCKYCKAALTDESEISLGYHQSCNDIIIKENSLTLNDVFSRFKILTHGNFKILDSKFEYETSEIIDFDFMNFLEENTLYINQTIAQKLVYLYLTNLNDIPFEISYFSDLIGLKVTNEFAISLNENLTFLTNLIALDLEFKDLIHGIEYLIELKKLVYLRLAGPLPEQFFFPESFSELNNLQIVKLESINSPNVVDFLSNLQNLKNLSLSIGIINETFKPMNSLEEAHFSNIRFNYDFSGLFISKNLRKVSFSNCPIEILPEFNPDSSILESLDICNCPIIRLPNSMSKISSLKVIQLRNTQLKEIPYEIKNITSLLIDKSLITDIKQEIENLEKLVSLSITNSRLKSVTVNISKLEKLLVLNLTGTLLSELPEEITSLQKLQVLNLSNNNLKTIPKVVYSFKNLKELIFDRNGPIENFSEEIENLENLERLSLKLVDLTEQQKSFLNTLKKGNPNLEIVLY